jgi:hypothetical protein
LIMPGACMDIVGAWAEEIRQDVKQLMVQDLGKPLGPITISLGAATLPEPGATREEIKGFYHLRLPPSDPKRKQLREVANRVEYDDTVQ